jgi:uncharacterized surface protein with fasciclin (FAS1) repeats
MATILQIANADRNISLFTKALKASGLETKLAEVGPFTILAPVNLAVRKLNGLSFDQMMEPANNEKLTNWLSEFILTGKKKMVDFRHQQKLPTLNGKQVLVASQNGDVTINGARILSHDRQGINGVVHVLDNTYKLA